MTDAKSSAPDAKPSQTVNQSAIRRLRNSGEQIGRALASALPKLTTQRSRADAGEPPDTAGRNRQKLEQKWRLPIPPGVAKAFGIVWGIITTFIGTLVFAALVLTAGIGSAWYAVHSGLPFNTYRSGPWVVWTHVGSLDHDPYSQARFAQMGALTAGSDRVVRFEARTDSDGRRLHSACTYELNSPPLNANYWTLGVFDTYGQLIPNAAERYGFSMASVARDPRGAFKITLARDAQPGNWLPTGTAGRMVLIFQAVESDDGGVDTTGVTRIVPPTIRRTAC
jgi:hypothetical protein